jgi:RNA recognition motif-containing protein
MSVRLYVGNLPKEPIERQALQEMFVEAGESITTKVIKDRKTGKCRGFAFVTVPNDEMADQFIEKYNGQAFMDSPIKIEKALPRDKGKNQEDSQGEVQTAAASAMEAPVSKNSGRKSNKKRSRSQSSSTAATATESFQPDPRWAQELAKLKEILLAQAANN